MFGRLANRAYNHAMQTSQVVAPIEQTSRARPVRRRLGVIILTAALIVIGAWIVVMPGGVLGHADLVGYAICHRIPERSFFIGGQQLPLCARCSGTYLGALAAFAVMYLLGRRRAANLPPVVVLVVLVLFVAAMGFDGVNSYLTLFPGMPHLYEPHNWLRLTTGTLEGIALAGVVLPVFNQTMWANATDERSLRNLRELGLVVLVGIVIIGIVLAEPPALLYPLAILSSGSVLWMLTLINSVLVTIFARQENRAVTWRNAAPLMLVGLAMTLAELSTIDLGRAYLTRALGLPF
jgi:uncharacterized membrane protein